MLSPRITLKPILNNKPKASGEYTVFIRVLLNRKKLLYHTGIDIVAKHWNPNAVLDKANWIKTSHKWHHRHNQHILALLTEIREVFDKTPPRDIEAAKQALQLASNPPPPETFTGLTERMLNEKNISGVIKPATRHIYNSSARLINDFTPGLRIDRLNRDWAVNFIRWMVEVRGLKPNTVRLTIQNVKTVLNYHRIENDLERLPLPKPLATTKALTQEQLGRLITFQPRNAAERFAKDVFLFQFYAHGLRISEVLKLRRRNIVGLTIIIESDKTAARLTVDLRAELVEIMNKYRGDFVFGLDARVARFSLTGVIASCKVIVKKGLTSIGRSLGFHITSHMARHTFAEMARAISSDIKTISMALGHTSVTMTENYLSRTDARKTNELARNVYRNFTATKSKTQDNSDAPLTRHSPEDKE